MGMHDELERSVGGRRSGLHPLAWVAVGFLTLSVLGVGAAAVGGYVMAKRVGHVIEEVREAPMETLARTLESHPDFEVVDAREGRGQLVLRDLKRGATRTLDLSDAVDGRLSFNTDEGRVTIDLRGGEDGGQLTVTKNGDRVLTVDAFGEDGQGSLVIRGAGDDILRLDATGNEEGGRLVVRTQDGEVLRFDAEGSDDSGWLRVQTPEGELLRVEMDGDANEVTLHSPGSSMTFHGVEKGGEIPRWVPDYYDMDSGPHIYTAQVEEGAAGAYRFSTDDALKRVIEFFEDILRDRGFEVETQSLEFNERQLQASLTAETDDQVVQVILVDGPGDVDTQGFVTYWVR